MEVVAGLLIIGGIVALRAWVWKQNHCPYCRERRSPYATICPHCRSPLT